MRPNLTCRRGAVVAASGDAAASVACGGGAVASDSGDGGSVSSTGGSVSAAGGGAAVVMDGAGAAMDGGAGAAAEVSFGGDDSFALLVGRGAAGALRMGVVSSSYFLVLIVCWFIVNRLLFVGCCL